MVDAAAPPARKDPPYAADEATMLKAYLDYHRETFRWKTSGLTREQMATTHPPSTLTLAGLVKHLALVEDWWFGVILTGREHMSPFAEADFDTDPDWEFHTADGEEPASLHDLWERAVAAADETVAAAADGLDTLSVKRPKGGDGISLRWIVLHMIEEYARHNGHADLIRERVDGLAGE